MLFLISSAVGILSLGSILLLVSMLTSVEKEDKGGETAFECGFDPKCGGRLPFSLRFYLIAIIFLVFDVEIVFLLPLVPSWHSGVPALMVSGGVFVAILILGTVYEWWEGSFDWAQ
uniref:NADH-ubiquinone oxidoreductase chain 3 n=1 Tax=Orthione mesoamericana TaxID=2480053 RepID=A0A8K1Y3I8_9CRUS|nr:NADH dehydrogenase subunit 3 [Orthione mesoamericana]